jgi:hypothetical protein
MYVQDIRGRQAVEGGVNLHSGTLRYLLHLT